MNVLVEALSGEAWWLAIIAAAGVVVAWLAARARALGRAEALAAVQAQRVTAARALEARTRLEEAQREAETKATMDRIVARVEVIRAEPPPAPGPAQDREAAEMLADAQRRWDAARGEHK